MRFTISAKSLATALSQVGKVQSGKYSSAVLELTYLRAEGGKVHLMACDAESKLFARKSISASVSEQGATLIDGKTLRALVQTFSAGQLTISSESGKEFAKVSWSGGSMSIPQETNIKDYPAIARTEKFKGEDIAEYSCDSDMLKEGLSAVAYAQCKESNKPLMCSVLMDILKDSTSFVASNLQTLTIRRYATSLTESEEGAKLVLPTPFVSALSALLPKETACVNITHRNSAEGWAKFAWNDTEVFGAMAVGKYPNYLAIIPKSADKRLEVSKETLLSALTRLSLTSNSLHFDIKEDASLQCRSLTIKAVSDILGTAEEIVQGSEYKGSPISVGLKTDNIMSVCRMLQGETITMELTDPRKAVVIKGSKTTEGVCDTTIMMPFTLRADVPAKEEKTKTETPKVEEKKTEETKEEVKETPEEVAETAVQVHDETPAEVADETDEVEDETTEDEEIEEEEYEGSAV